MPHSIPKKEKDRERWGRELVHQCFADIEERIQRGALYRNIYLTGDENGNPATYPKTYAYIDNLASFLFSALELRYLLKFQNGGNLTDRAMGKTAAADMSERMRDAGVYDTVAQTVEWSLVKGKTIFKLNWEDGNFAPYMIQPEFFGVRRPDIAELSRQDCFVHVSYYTPGSFVSAFRALPNLGKIMQRIAKEGTAGRKEGDRPERASALKQIVLGGLNPFQQGPSSPAQASSRGIVNWLGGPQATFDPKVLAQLIRLDELWVKDERTDDWATFQFVGDVLVTGGDVIRNAMADAWDPDNTMRRLPDEFRDHNPLSHMHPFRECAPNQLNGYFWGRSEICNVGVLQMQLNARLNGIARLLRRQENPPKLYTGSTAINQAKYSAGDKPGAWFSDPTPNAKAQDLYPQLPDGLWESLHENERMFDEMAGLPPVLMGRGESGVRAQGHAETLTRNASPRFKDRALAVERFVADVGSLGLAYLRAMVPDTLTAWLPPETKSPVALLQPDEPELEAPAEGMKPLPFRYIQIPDNVKVRVDSHSSSPVFSAETRDLIFEMVHAQMMTPEEAVEHLHPPGEDEIVADMERKQIQLQAFLKQHPEAQIELLTGKRAGGKKR